MKRLGVLAADYLYIEDGPMIRTYPWRVADSWEPHSLPWLFAFADTWRLRQLWVHPSWIALCGYPLLSDEFMKWDIRPQGKEIAPWYHGFFPGVHGDGIDVAFPGLDDRAAWRKAQDGQQLLREVQAYNKALGLEYSWSPGHTGSALIRAVHGGGQSQSSRFTRLDAPSDFPGPAMLSKAPAREMAWIRALTEQERLCGWLHSFDKNGAYLGASGGELGLGEWEYGGGHFYHKGDKITIPGYWCIVGYDVPLILPDVLDPDGYNAIHPEKEQWVTTPALNAMLEHSVVDIAESYTWPQHSRVLSPWQVRLRQSRQDLADYPLALETLKSTYSMAIGLLGSSMRKSDQSNMLYRPDWRHMIIGQSTANTWRRIVRAVTNGVSVVAAAADCLYVVSDTADASVVALQAGIPLGVDLKDCKVQDSVPLASVLEFFDHDRMAGYGTRYLALSELRAHLAAVEVSV